MKLKEAVKAMLKDDEFKKLKKHTYLVKDRVEHDKRVAELLVDNKVGSIYFIHQLKSLDVAKDVMCYMLMDCECENE